MTRAFCGMRAPPQLIGLGLKATRLRLQGGHAAAGVGDGALRSILRLAQRLPDGGQLALGVGKIAASQRQSGALGVRFRPVQPARRRGRGGLRLSAQRGDFGLKPLYLPRFVPGKDKQGDN